MPKSPVDTKTHNEYVNSTVAFDLKRAQNGEAAYKAGTLFNPKSGLGVMSLAEYFFPDAIDVIQKASGTTKRFPNWQLVLNKARRYI